MQKILGSIFESILGSENEDMDLKDRAAFYYRFLKANPQELSKVISQKNQNNSIFIEDDESLRVFI